MKSVLKPFLITFIAASLFSACAQAQHVSRHTEEFFSEFYVVQVKPMEFLLTYHFPQTDRVLVRIKDGEKNILFAEKTLVYKKYKKFFDLSSMKDGNFTFELTDGETTYSRSFAVVTETKRIATIQKNESFFE